jgi:coenzyme F420-reducing hydrogenase beta subunit
MAINITNPTNCCGCTACIAVCPKEAISMQPDTMGFLYPVVDERKCVGCGKCEKVCAFSDRYDKSANLEKPLAFGARHKDMKEVATSRSGAAFIALSDVILNSGGVIYGAGYVDHFRVAHKRATTKQQRDEFKGSKYVQSDLQGTFSMVKNDLQSGLTVMFSGTPCQTAGLASFIGTKLRDKLFLVDLICHGVPSPYIWRDFLSYIEKKHGGNVVRVNFRDKKKYGWTAHKETFKFNGEVEEIHFSFIFYKHIIFRHSCGKCHYTNLQRPSDITLGDFWGWEKTNPEFNKDDKGISLLLVNTEKGRWLLEQARKDLNTFPANIEDCLQSNLQEPTRIPPARNEFEKLYAKKGFLAAMKRYGDMGWRYKLAKPFLRLLSNETKLKLKRLLLHI